MLPAATRLRDPQTFRKAIRRGKRAGSRTLVLHYLVSETGHDRSSAQPAQVGLVVSKAVGSAVTRNLVKRRIRALARERLGVLPGASVLVVRANPAAARASHAELGRDFSRCLQRVTVVGVVGAEVS